MSERIAYIRSTNILTDTRQIIESARHIAYRAINVVLVQRNWLLGKRIYKYMRFYQCFPNILDAASPKSFLLSWTHYRTLLQVDDEKARNWYEQEAARETWSARKRFIKCNTTSPNNNE